MAEFSSQSMNDTCIDAQTLLEDLTTKLMQVESTNFDSRPDLQASLFMLGILYTNKEYASAIDNAAINASSRQTITSQAARDWFKQQPAFENGLDVAKAMLKDMGTTIGGRRRKHKGKRRMQRGGFTRSTGFKRSLAYMVAISLLAAGYFGQVGLFSQTFGMDTTFSGLQTMLNTYLIEKGVLYGRCSNDLSTGIRLFLSPFTGGTVWTCSQFAAADQATLTKIYTTIAASGFSFEMISGAVKSSFTKLVDAVDYILFDAMPHLGMNVITNSQNAIGSIASGISKSFQTAVGISSRIGQAASNTMTQTGRRIGQAASNTMTQTGRRIGQAVSSMGQASSNLFVNPIVNRKRKSEEAYEKSSAQCPDNEEEVIAAINNDLDAVQDELQNKQTDSNEEEIHNIILEILGNIDYSESATETATKRQKINGGRKTRRRNKRKTRKGKKSKGKKYHTRKY